MADAAVAPAGRPRGDASDRGAGKGAAGWLKPSGSVERSAPRPEAPPTEKGMLSAGGDGARAWPSLPRPGRGTAPGFAGSGCCVEGGPRGDETATSTPRACSLA
eukprot:scaffold39828_cov36-Phaeocystis_antarctica.AAC.1